MHNAQAIHTLFHRKILLFSHAYLTCFVALPFHSFLILYFICFRHFLVNSVHITFYRSRLQTFNPNQQTLNKNIKLISHDKSNARRFKSLVPVPSSTDFRSRFDKWNKWKCYLKARIKKQTRLLNYSKLNYLNFKFSLIIMTVHFLNTAEPTGLNFVFETKLFNKSFFLS